MKILFPALASLFLLSGCTTTHVIGETLHTRLKDDPSMLVKYGVPAETGRWGLWAMSYRGSSSCAKTTKKALHAAVMKELQANATISQDDQAAIESLEHDSICSQEILKPTTTDTATAR